MNTNSDQETNSANLTEDQRKALARSCQEASVIEETFGAGILASISGSSLSSQAGPRGFKAYRDRVLAASGAPKDPIEVMLIEQLTWAHHRLADLHVAATVAKLSDQVSALTNASAKLMAEFRKSSLALREYRSPTTPKQVMVVKQQNVAAGNQQVALVEAEVPGLCNAALILSWNSYRIAFRSFPDRSQFVLQNRALHSEVQQRHSHRCKS